MPNNSLLQTLKRSKNLLYIFILALVVALVWIVLGVYHVTVQTTISPEIQKLTKPLNPAIDTQVLEKLSTRTQYSAEELATFPINKQLSEEEAAAISATPTPTPKSTASGSATPIPSSTPTPTPTSTPTPPAESTP